MVLPSFHDWDTSGLMEVVAKMTEARDARKYLFIWDKQGGVATFYQYKGHLVELHRPLIKATLG